MAAVLVGADFSNSLLHTRFARSSAGFLGVREFRPRRTPGGARLAGGTNMINGLARRLPASTIPILPAIEAQPVPGFSER